MKKFNIYALVCVLGISLLVTPATSHALTNTEVQSKIESLLKQIEILKNQLEKQSPAKDAPQTIPQTEAGKTSSKDEVIVTTQAELETAIKNTVGGEKVLLAPGTYTILFVKDKSYTSPVTFTSKDKKNPAVLKELRTYNANNVVVKDLTVSKEMVDGKDFDWTKLSQITNSKNITFDSIKFTTTGTPKIYLGWGAFTRDSENITIKNCEFTKLAVGSNMMNSKNVVVENNVFKEMRIDGAEFTAINKGRIQGNFFTDFRSSYLYHADMIQFWTSGTKVGSNDILIQDNIMMPGTGKGSQGIFIQDEVGGAPHKNIEIRNNLLLDAGEYWNGLTVRGGVNIIMEGNTAISPTGDPEMYWIRLDNVDGASVKNNVVDHIIQKGSKNIIESNNIYLKTQKDKVELIKDINKGANATIDGLIIPDIGYQKSGSTPPAPVTPPSKDVPTILPKPETSNQPTPVGTATDDGTPETTTTSTTNTTNSASGISNGVSSSVLFSASITSYTGLRFGMQSDAVTALQEKLRELGFYTHNTTGYFGQITENAVKAFQEKNGLEPVGYVGPKTAKLLLK